MAVLRRSVCVLRKINKGIGPKYSLKNHERLSPFLILIGP
jgi:hypothetical protein